MTTPAPSAWPFPRYVIRKGVPVMVRPRKPKPDMSSVEAAPF